MKNLIIGLISLGSMTVSASQTYSCTDAKSSKVVFELQFETNTKVIVTDAEESETTLEIAKSNSKNVVMGDYDWDGYGGYMELSLPSSFSTTDLATIKKFKATLKTKTYSEVGLVYSGKVKAICELKN